MPEFDDLLLTVRTRSTLRDPTEARLAITAVAGSLAACLDDPDRNALPRQSQRSLAAKDGESELSLSVSGFVEEVARRSGWPLDRSKYAAQAVLSALAEHDPELRQAVLRRLPLAAELFSPPGAPA
ncbi:MAG: hypothetical protein QOG52_464 [Frankiaceae bacterium]|jgi:uncharacterized protein (DUF2267 family)|nr:hypothetical protein [Frankiales bacterium]MDQ1681632.1 hypothetical protein [Frankiaceae bacterium]MDQ1714836.1 hypothetical protein [Frankiaceae bacterium]MDQ1723436.1 hypothetical protein [Frankiaceae bacterium]